MEEKDLDSLKVKYEHFEEQESEKETKLEMEESMEQSQDYDKLDDSVDNDQTKDDISKGENIHNLKIKRIRGNQIVLPINIDTNTFADLKLKVLNYFLIL
jgi:hypothetical protein